MGPSMQLVALLAVSFLFCTVLQETAVTGYSSWGGTEGTGALLPLHCMAARRLEGSSCSSFRASRRRPPGIVPMEGPTQISSGEAEPSRQLGRSTAVPPETPEEVKREIRQRRLANPLPASRPLKNDSLRLALLGPQAFSALVSQGPPGAPGPLQSPLDTFGVPVWVMRQAGRYLPEFQAIRAKHKFLTVCKDPLLAAEVTLQPLRRFPQLDAVIIFSDILVIPEAMGMPLSVEEGVGPAFAWRLEGPEDMKRLDPAFDVEDKLGYVFDAIYATVEQLEGRVPLIGFCGAPLTLFCYMVEGRGAAAKGWRRCKEFLLSYPEESLLLLHQIATAAAKYLIKQVDAGAQVLQVFDTNAGVFSPEMYSRFGVPFMQQIAETVSAERPGVPLIAFPKDQPLASFVSSSFSAVSLGWATERDTAKARFQKGAPLGVRPSLDAPEVKALQGNLDPQLLYAPDDVIKEQTAAMVRAFQPGRYVANLGHGMEPQMSPRKLGVFLQAVKDTAAEIKKDHARHTSGS